MHIYGHINISDHKYEEEDDAATKYVGQGPRIMRHQRVPILMWPFVFWKAFGYLSDLGPSLW